MSAPTTEVLLRRKERSAFLRRRRRAILVSLLATAAMFASVFLLNPDDRLMGFPMMAIAALVLGYVMVLWARDGALPIFEAGTLCMLAVGVYGIVPLAGFILMDGQWAPGTDNRLFHYPFIPAELAAFGWRYVVYAAGFAVAYVVIRGRASVGNSMAFRLPKATTQAAVAIIFVSLYSINLLLKLLYGYDPEGMHYGSAADFAALVVEMQAKPYFVRQIGHNTVGMMVAARQAVVLLLLAQWRKRWCRWLLVGWLTFEVATVAVRLGSRSSVVLLLLGTAVLYHRLVRRVSFRLAIVGGTLMLSGFLILGAIRGGVLDSGDVGAKRVLTAANEFQGLFTTAFDIHKRKEMGQIRDVPWELYASDYVLIIPSQFLPFEKMEGGQWYIDLIGATGKGIGYMFGVMSQAVLGLDWIEFVLRGAVLATCLALLQRWYVRRATLFWPTLFCLFVSIYTYYTFRASTFYPVYFLLYRFVPFFLATNLLAKVLERVGGESVRVQRAPARGTG